MWHLGGGFFFQERETSWCNYAGAGSESKM